VVVLVNGDTVDEAQETLFLDISNVQNATVNSSRGDGFIVDDDGPTISINDVSVTEGNSGTKAATFTLSLSGPSVEAIAVRAITNPGTATTSSDYNAINLVVTFQPGTVTRTFDVGIIGDTNLESNEIFFVNLSFPFGTTIADGQGVQSREAPFTVADAVARLVKFRAPVDPNPAWRPAYEEGLRRFVEWFRMSGS